MTRTLVENDQLRPEAWAPVIRDYFKEERRVTGLGRSGEDQSGEEVFLAPGAGSDREPAVILTAFLLRREEGVQVLALTSRLYTNPTRRVVVTAQMVVDVLRPGGLAPGGTGVRTAQKVRLMHAGVRNQIGSYPAWNPEFGKPISQEDMAGTLLSSSWVIIDGLRRLSMHLEELQAEATLEHGSTHPGHSRGVASPQDGEAEHLCGQSNAGIMLVARRGRT